MIIEDFESNANKSTEKEKLSKFLHFEENLQLSTLKKEKHDKEMLTMHIMQTFTLCYMVIFRIKFHVMYRKRQYNAVRGREKREEFIVVFRRLNFRDGKIDIL